MTFKELLSCGITDNVARTNGLGSMIMRESTLQKKVLEYLKSNKMAALTWPKCKPDLNLVENVWHLMEDVVYRDKQYNDRKELIRALEKCAKKFNKETIMHLHKSIPWRLLKVTDIKRAEIL